MASINESGPGSTVKGIITGGATPKATPVGASHTPPSGVVNTAKAARKLSFGPTSHEGDLDSSTPSTPEEEVERPEETPNSERERVSHIRIPHVEGDQNTQVVISASVLNSLMANQSTLADMVAEYKTLTAKAREENEALNARLREEEEARKEAEVARSRARTEREAYEGTRVDPKDAEDAPVTQAELRRILQAHKEGGSVSIDLNPPFTADIAAYRYPPGYAPPAFRKFDGTGSAREHLMTYVDDLGVHSGDLCLRLREFSKSLIGRAFTWYSKLRPASIHTWEEMTVEFCNKFLEEEGAIHIMDLGRVRQRVGEGLVPFIKRYRDRALHCKETLPEADLVYGCIKSIEDGLQIFLALSKISTFSELLARALDVNEAMKKQGKRTKEQATFDVNAADDQGKKKNYKTTPSKELPPKLPISKELACQLIEEWFKEGILQERTDRRPPTSQEYEDPMYL